VCAAGPLKRIFAILDVRPMLNHPVYTSRRPIPELPFDPSRTALLVVDVQRFVADPGMGFGRMARENGTFEATRAYYERIAAILPRIRSLQDACRERGMEVIFARIEAHTRDGREVLPGYRLSGLLVPKGSPEAEILPEVAPLDNEIVLSKNSSSAFSSTPLDQVLRNLGLDRLILTGVATHACVELTARDADDRGYRVYVGSDACAAATPELHDGALARMDKGFTKIKTTAELLAMVRGGEPDSSGGSDRQLQSTPGRRP
jgi:ureidoacrylate peracid hydrolase